LAEGLAVAAAELLEEVLVGERLQIGAGGHDLPSVTARGAGYSYHVVPPACIVKPRGTESWSRGGRTPDAPRRTGRLTPPCRSRCSRRRGRLDSPGVPPRPAGWPLRPQCGCWRGRGGAGCGGRVNPQERGRRLRSRNYYAATAR